MIRKRELLKRCAVQLNSTLNGTTSMRLAEEIEELLSQPEQEPVAWYYVYDDGERPPYDNVTQSMPIGKNYTITPLYTAPQKCEGITPRQGLEEYKKGYTKAKQDLKREPLSDEDICEILFKKEWKGFVELVRQIEKEHGIGVGDE